MFHMSSAVFLAISTLLQPATSGAISTAATANPYIKRDASQSVNINRWKDMSDQFDSGNFGLYELYNIKNWISTEKSEMQGETVFMNQTEISDAVWTIALRAMRSRGPAFSKPSHWREFVDENGDMAFYFGIDSSDKWMKEAIGYVTHIPEVFLEIHDYGHHGKWEDWRAKYSPFRFHHELTKREHIDDRLPQVNIDAAGLGYNSMGGIKTVTDEDWRTNAAY